MISNFVMESNLGVSTPIFDINNQRIRELCMILKKMLDHSLDNNADRCNVSYEFPDYIIEERDNIYLVNSLLEKIIRDEVKYHNIDSAVVDNMYYDSMSRTIRLNLTTNKKVIYKQEVEATWSFTSNLGTGLGRDFYNNYYDMKFKPIEKSKNRENPKYEFDY